VPAKDFSGQVLRGIDFSGVNLVGAIFRDADLRGANLDQAYIAGADFSNANMERVNLGHLIASTGIVFLNEGAHVASLDVDNHVRLWDVGTRRELFVAGMPSNVLCYCVLGKSVLVMGTTEGVSLLDTSTAEIRTLTGTSGPVRSVTTSSDGRALAYYAPTDSSVQLLDLRKTSTLLTYSVEMMPWNSLTLSLNHNGTLLLIGQSPGAPIVLNTSTSAQRS
jgi:WD40 repeat protein